MSNLTFRRWTADDIAKLKNLAQRLPRAEIAATLGPSVPAATLKAHEPKLSLRTLDDCAALTPGQPDGFERESELEQNH